MIKQITPLGSSTTHDLSARYMHSPDTRATVLNPNELVAIKNGVQFDFKQASVTGLTGYSGVLSYRPYASNSDWSGGPAHQIAFNNTNGLYWRVSTGDTTWGDWKQLVTNSGTWSISITGNAATATKAGYIEGTNDAANPGGALLRSGAGRADSSPAGDTWIYWDTLGGTSSYWGIRHNQAANTIGFYGGGNERVVISMGESKVAATTFAGKATSAGTADIATKFASAQSITLTGDTTGTASSQAGWSIATTTNQLSYKSQITTLDDLDAFGKSGLNMKIAKVSALDGHTGTLTKNDGMILALPWSGGYGHQFYVDDNGYGLHHRYWYTHKVNDVDTVDFNNWVQIIDSSNYINYTVKKDGTGASGTWGINITGNAATSTKMGVASMWTYSENNNELNFGGTNNSSTIYIGYRAKDSKPIPAKFVFGSSTGTADLQVKTVYLGSGTSSYISSTNYTGNAATATKLTTARKINGTNFDGSADITTANWGTARDITIGGTKKSINGSQAYIWTNNEINRIQIGSQLDHERVVIGLCELSAANTGIQSNWHGKIYRVRNNGLIPDYFADVDFNAAYSTTNGFFYSLITDYENTGTTARSGEGYRACVFKYNNKYYGGLEFKQTQASAFYANGVGDFTPFAIAYYNDNTATVKNTEINDSITFATAQCVRQQTNGSFKGSLEGNASSANAVKDYNNGTLTKFGYSTSGMTTASWIGAWDATVSGEYRLRAITPANVVKAGTTGGTKAQFYRGDNTWSNTLEGTLNLKPPTGSWVEGIRIHSASTGWATIVLCGTDNTGDTGTSANSWSLHSYNGDFYLANNGSNTATTRITGHKGNGFNIHPRLGIAQDADSSYALAITGNTKNNGIVYFANGTTYFINNSGTAHLLEISGRSLGVAQTDGTGKGISLYGGAKGTSVPEYGLAFMTTGNGGKFGDVQSDWATYFTMNAANQRGWIWKQYNQTGTAYMAGALSSRGVASFKGLTGETSYIAFPQGGTYTTSTATITGALKITLPQYKTNTMMSFDVNIYTYDGTNATTTVYHISGYEYGNSGWHDPVCRVYSEGTGNYTDLKVRFGYDGSKACVTIGETNTAWSYPQVAISNIYCGYGNYTPDKWGYGWAVGFVTTLPDTISGSRTAINTQSINITGNAATATRANITTTTGSVAYYSGTTGTFSSDANFTWDATNNQVTVTHKSGKGDGFRTYYGTTVDMFFGIGSGNTNHGIYDSKANKWMIYADTNGNVKVNGTADIANKLGTTTVGSFEQPIYLNNGTATEASTTKTLQGATAIANGEDLNAYATPGNYAQTQTSYAQTNLNTPFGATASTNAVAFRLTVESPIGGKYRRQVYESYNGGLLAERTSTNTGTSWSTWRTKLWKQSDAATAEGSASQPVYINGIGRALAITSVGTAYGGTGNTSFTANRLVYSESATKLSSATSLYATSTSLGVNATSLSTPTIIENLANTQSTITPSFQVNGKSYYSDTLIIAPNKRAIEFRPNNNTYSSYIYYGTSGNEALNFVNRNTVTSFLFWTGNSVNSSSQWYLQEDNTTARTDNPAIQIKKNSLYINKLLPTNSNPEYKLYINGTTCGSDTATFKTVVISSTGADEHLKFSRAGSWNYITVPFDNANTVLSLNNSTGSANSYYQWTPTTYEPGTSYTKSLGTNSLRWKEAYIGAFRIGGDAANSIPSRTITSASTFYINRPASTSVIFQTDSVNKVLLDPNNAFRPETNNTLSIGTSSYKWADMYATTFHGALDGNASTATTLQTARTINGTSFNGSANITTANWGTARNIYIADNSATNTGPAVSVNGSANATLKLPATIKATLTGAATDAANTQSNYGAKSFIVEGDANTYYPTLITNATSHNAWTLLNISRGYSEQAPDTWNTSTHRGGLTMTILTNGDTAWGGNHQIGVTKLNTILDLSQSYCTMVGDILCTNFGLVIWLRGGTAKYWITSNGGQSVTVTTYYESHTQSSNTVAPITTVNTTRIDSYRWNNLWTIKTASQLATSRTIALTGDVTGSGSFNGSANLSIPTTVSLPYGATLPSSGTEGKVFLQTSAEYYELPTGGAIGQVLAKKTAADRSVQWINLPATGINVSSSTAKFYPIGTTSNSNGAVSTAAFNSSVYVENNVLFGAAWNDYAEFRQPIDSQLPTSGMCVVETGDDTLEISTKRMQPGAAIVSDTYGFAIGRQDKAICPIAVSGRVLAYPYEDREEFKKNIGRPVCAGPNGTVSIMTDEEYKNYGYCAIGTISAVPNYETWGENNVPVNNRVWIKVR